MVETTGYGKRPMSQWIAIYAVVALVVYGAIYYFYMGRKGRVGYSSGSPASTTAKTIPGSSNENIYTIKMDEAKGKFMADFAGMSLYVYDRDNSGVSNCTGSCLVAWPAYSSGATAQNSLPADITVITRPDGSHQFAWMGKPLYYYANDAKPGDVTGDGVGGVWHLVSL
jgi:predicted lipoprotein with Yx(FWY)xxD motif